MVTIATSTGLLVGETPGSNQSIRRAWVNLEFPETVTDVFQPRFLRFRTDSAMTHLSPLGWEHIDLTK